MSAGASVAATRSQRRRRRCRHGNGSGGGGAITSTALGTVVAAAAAAAAAAGTGCVALARPTASDARSAAIHETKRNSVSQEPAHSAMETCRHMSRPTYSLHLVKDARYRGKE
jgi:hypothetical protein